MHSGMKQLPCQRIRMHSWGGRSPTHTGPNLVCGNGPWHLWPNWWDGDPFEWEFVLHSACHPAGGLPLCCHTRGASHLSNPKYIFSQTSQILRIWSRDGHFVPQPQQQQHLDTLATCTHPLGGNNSINTTLQGHTLLCTPFVYTLTLPLGPHHHVETVATLGRLWVKNP